MKLERKWVVGSGGISMSWQEVDMTEIHCILCMGFLKNK